MVLYFWVVLTFKSVNSKHLDNLLFSPGFSLYKLLATIAKDLVRLIVHRV